MKRVIRRILCALERHEPFDVRDRTRDAALPRAIEICIHCPAVRYIESEHPGYHIEGPWR